SFQRWTSTLLKCSLEFSVWSLKKLFVGTALVELCEIPLCGVAVLFLSGGFVVDLSSSPPLADMLDLLHFTFNPLNRFFTGKPKGLHSRILILKNLNFPFFLDIMFV
ncbi:MAG: hypothetical protein V1890_04515, partial [Candidatus Zixiibacteriota bacterium]